MSKRIYTNRYIQEELANILKGFSEIELDKFCDANYSKTIFDNNYPLLVRVPSNYTHSDKMNAIKDHNGINRWTWKFEFQKNGFSYAISTQWYDRNDEYVKRWLRKYSN
jgi:hypothetical protein